MMAKESKVPVQSPSTLEGLAASAVQACGAPPVHLWNPPFCGDIDMRIARDGSWFYGGTPIGRPALVKLFASVLRKDEDRFVLVTPVEKVGIVVEDAPFLAVEMVCDPGAGSSIRLRTNVDDWVEVGPDHPLRFEPGASGSLKPYVRVRGDLWALVGRSVFYDLMERCETRDVGGVATCGIAAGASFFPVMTAEALDAAGQGAPLG